MKLVDSHCHLNFSTFKEKYNEILTDCLKKQIGLINIGSQVDTSKRAIEIANKYPGDPVYASIGLHPTHLSQTEIDPENGFAVGTGEEEIKFKSREEKFDEQKYQELINNDINNKIVAIGETGLDYFHIPENRDSDQIKEIQKQDFIQQLKFAQKNKLPIILHARGSKDNPNDAYLDLLNILKNQKPARRSQDLNLRFKYRSLPKSAKISKEEFGEDGSGLGVIHCFGSTLEIAQKFLDLGFYIGFTGIITFKNKSVNELQRVAKYVPLDRILIETDAPYLSPEPYRGQQNRPEYVEFVAKKVAELKSVDYKKVCQVTTDNVCKLFSLKQ